MEQSLVDMGRDWGLGIGGSELGLNPLLETFYWFLKRMIEIVTGDSGE
jgi:hypothetical protein